MSDVAIIGAKILDSGQRVCPRHGPYQSFCDACVSELAKAGHAPTEPGQAHELTPWGKAPALSIVRQLTGNVQKAIQLGDEHSIYTVFVWKNHCGHWCYRAASSPGPAEVAIMAVRELDQLLNQNMSDWRKPA